MFKNLKKKMEDVGADLSAVSIPGTLGSSLSSLRRSESKTSGLSVSRESLQSQSSQSDPPERIIRTSSFVSASGSSSFGTLIPLPPVAEPDAGSTVKQDSSDDMRIVDLSQSKASLDTVVGSLDDIQIVDFGDSMTSFDSPSDTLLALDGTPPVQRSLSLVDEPIIDTSPVLVPVLVEEAQTYKGSSPSPVQHANYDSMMKESESLKRQLKEKDAAELQNKQALSAKDVEIMKLKAESDRYRDIVSKSRASEERLRHDAEAKMLELTEQINGMKLEQRSWKIAADDTNKQLKEKETSLLTMTRQVSDVEKRLALARNTDNEQKLEIDRYRQENASVKAAASILEHQIDQLLKDIQNERSLKEAAQNELKSFQESSQVELERHRGSMDTQVKTLNAQIQNRDEQHAVELKNLRNALADRETELAYTQQTFVHSSKSADDENLRKIVEFEEQIRQKEKEIDGLKDDVEEKDSVIASLETRTTEFEARIKSLEEDVDSKETTLAIIRRKSAKDMESKLRERDRQIANLERQVTDLSEKVAKVVLPVEKPSSAMDPTSHAYLKNVMLKFVTGTDEEATQLIRAVAMLLKLSPEEEVWVRDVLIWKQSWLPAPKPELHHSSSSSQNGSP